MNVCNAGGPVVAFSGSCGSEEPPLLSLAEEAEWAAYCRAREAQERAAAKRARSIEARRIHQELAQGYARFRNDRSQIAAAAE